MIVVTASAVQQMIVVTASAVQQMIAVTALAVQHARLTFKMKKLRLRHLSLVHRPLTVIIQLNTPARLRADRDAVLVNTRQPAWQ
jgi:hypothetical protein